MVEAEGPPVVSSGKLPKVPNVSSHGDDEASWNGSSRRSSHRSHQSQLQHSFTSGESELRAVAGMGSIPLQPGEQVESEFERPLSAPPPPGFSEGAEGRSKLATELLWGAPTHQGKGTYDSANHVDRADRNGSFGNLASMLGSGFVQSMEDATHEKNDPKDDLNFHRQTRQAALRLLGSSPPKNKDSHKVADTTGSSEFSANAAPFVMSNEQYTRAPGHSNVPGTSGISRGFPSSLSSPNRKPPNETEEKREAQRGDTTPVQMYPGQTGHRRALPPSKDIGLNVVEPEGDSQFSGMRLGTGVQSQRLDSGGHRPQPDPALYELQQGMKKMWTVGGGGAAAASTPERDDVLSTISDPSLGVGSEISSRQAEAELRPFLWDIDRNMPGRTLAILHVSYLRVPDVRSSCEAFGVLDSFRSDFASRGIFFVSYYDIRSAQYAANELQPILQRLSLAQRSSEDVVVRYCLPLNSSSQFDESQVVISDLPPEVNEHVLSAMLSSYGAVRCITPQGNGSYSVEFHNLQDAKQALLELESSQPWGEGVQVEVGLRNPVDRKRGRDLLSMISRWRQGMSRPIADTSQTAAGLSGNEPWRQMQSQAMQSPHDPGQQAFGAFGGGAQPQTMTAQLVLGPDGRYTQVLVPTPSAYPQYGAGGRGMNPRQQQPQQQIIHGPNGQVFIAQMPVAQQNSHMLGPQQIQVLDHPGFPSAVVSGHQFVEGRHGGPTNTPYYSHAVVSEERSVMSGLSGRSHRSAQSQGESTDNRHLLLDLDAVENGRDVRTSLMVRNIPNKYTQQMLLSEFMENGHGPGVIDFFYLPIDFKNRCNRGYAFINFVDHKDILAFHNRYFGKHWRTFNSDKICDITYARIQGKAAMLKRFENSALMEKDDEYKPLVFVSDGPEKGKRLPFPVPNRSS